MTDNCREPGRRRHPLETEETEEQPTLEGLRREIGELRASRERLALVAALRDLPRRQREVLALRYLGDLSIEQIAHETNTPAGTIKARLHRGRAQLAAALRHEESHHG